MKRLRHIFIIIAVLTTFSLKDNENSGAPTLGFQSTSTMASTGSTVTSAAATGGVFTCSMTTGKKFISVGPKREDEDLFGDEKIDDIQNPLEPGTPIGEGVWAMIIMAAGYCLFRKKVKKCSQNL